MTATQSATDLSTLIQQQWTRASGEQAYVLIDAAQDYTPVFQLREQFGKSPTCLFEGEEALVLADVAPYVCPVDMSEEFLAAWCGRWGGNHGVMLASSADLETLLGHLRSIFHGVEENGEEFYFRYYDPRVLCEHWGACSDEQRQQFCGPIASWCFEGDDPPVVVLTAKGS